MIKNYWFSSFIREYSKVHTALIQVYYFPFIMLLIIILEHGGKKSISEKKSLKIFLQKNLFLIWILSSSDWFRNLWTRMGITRMLRGSSSSTKFRLLTFGEFNIALFRMKSILISLLDYWIYYSNMKLKTMLSISIIWASACSSTHSTTSTTTSLYSVTQNVDSSLNCEGIGIDYF